MCVFVYALDNQSEPATTRKPLAFTEVYLGQVGVDDFRKNPRSELGTRTATSQGRHCEAAPQPDLSRLVGADLQDRKLRQRFLRRPEETEVLLDSYALVVDRVCRSQGRT